MASIEVVISFQQRSDNRHARLWSHRWIDIQHVERANLSAISTRTLIHCYQYFGFDLLIAKGEDSDRCISSREVTPADVTQIAVCS